MSVAFGWFGIAVAQADADGGIGAEDGLQRAVEILGEIVGEGAKRGDVKDLDRILQLAGGVVESELVQDCEERGEGFAGAGGGKDEDIGAALDDGPGRLLGGGWSLELLVKPCGDLGRSQMLNGGHVHLQ